MRSQRPLPSSPAPAAFERRPEDASPDQPEDCPACPCTLSAWPETVAQGYTEQGYREAFSKALEGAASDIGFELDCSEFPCLASITDRRLSKEERQELRRHLEETYPEAEVEWTRRNAVGPGGHSQIELVSFFPAELDTPDLRDSLRRRVGVMADRPREAVAAD